PIRINGIPSFIYEFLIELQQRGPIHLPRGSLVVTGGGWKAAEDKKVSRETFRNKITELLGVPSENIMDLYGLAEHCAPYNDCPHHRFHIPVYNRILVRDPETMQVLPPDKPGLLEFITPFNAMMPNLAILSTDVGMLDSRPCDCGFNAPTFTLIGRGGLVKHKGCAITAGEIVRRK
ncbi:MAG: acyl-protein synthetase, partial [Deltaproteobacteria bacterium]|nr:acyl-protein synthetase [Deltaproteobacteria bacterium]